MCGIWYLRHHSPEILQKALDLQIDRGTDAYWYIGDWIVNKMTTQSLTKEIFASDCTMRTAIPGKKWIAWHTRKSSVGAKDVDNAHPHKINDYIIMQNWTEKAFVEWGKVWFLDQFVTTASDTNYMLEYVIAKIKSWFKIEDILDWMINSSLVIGTVFIYNEQNKQLIFISDWLRDSYIQKDSEWKIESISSEAINIETQYNEDTKRKYSNIWYVIFDPKTGEIFKEHIEEKNFNKDCGLVKSKTYSYWYSSASWFTWAGVGNIGSVYNKKDSDKGMITLSKKQCQNILMVLKEAYWVGVDDNLLSELRGELRSKYIILWVAWDLHNFIKEGEDEFKIFFMNPKLFKIAVDVFETSGREYLHSILLNYIK